ncbi:hypothetical protein [Agromyces badenianii]|uniref:hypothetical protein n=1 Tax=Agromyces badenianii TaxID=2080742 RepID=UPI00105A620F|nr:hypothetical protein [Agromyces badenianii]
MMEKFEINKSVPGEQFSIEADSYRLDDGYFHFFAGFGQNAKRIASVSTNVAAVFTKATA